MTHSYPEHPPEVLPPEGVIEMACTKYGDDPELFHAYASFAGRVDAFLSCRGLQGWDALDVERFILSARTPSEAGTLCCMLATVLPWMVGAEDISRFDASRQLAALLESCPGDVQARTCVKQAIEQLEETEAWADGSEELRH
ncbi:MAG: hypothetical protein ACRBN8_38730 [Nannocystales bacterium]